MDIGAVYGAMFAALREGGIQMVMEAAYQIFKLPIAVTDASFKMLVPNIPPVPQGDDYWDRPLREMRVPLDVVQAFQEYHVIEKVCETPHNPIYLNWGPFEKSPRITTVVMVKGDVEGYIAIMCPEEQFVPSWQLPALAVVADAIGIALQKEQRVLRETDVLVGSFARDLMLGAIDRADFHKWMELTGLHLNGDYRVIAVQSQNKKHAVLQSYMQEYLRHRDLPIIMYPVEEILCILLYNQNASHKQSEALEEIFVLAKSLQAVCGVSRVFKDLHRLPVYRKQALDARNTGERLVHKKQAYFYEEYALTIKLFAIFDHMDMESCIHPAVIMLEQYDRKYNTNYLQTLQTYCFHMFDTAVTCQKLHIHRNTLLYRLNKISELTSLEFTCKCTNTEVLLSLHLLALERDALAQFPENEKEINAKKSDDTLSLTKL